MNRILATAVLLLIGAISTFVYRACNRSNERGPRPAAVQPSRFFYWVYLWLRLSTPLLIAASLNFPHPLLLLWHEAPAPRWIGIVVAAAGIAGFCWSMKSLGKNYSPCFDSLQPLAITTSGPYRLVRHPIYSSNLVMFAGFALATGSGWMLLNLAVLWACYEITAGREERQLAREFPEYQAYLERTRRFFPFFLPGRFTHAGEPQVGCSKSENRSLR